MKNLKTSFLAILMLLATFSCQTDELISPRLPEIKVEQGRLNFTSKEDLSSFLNQYEDVEFEDGLKPQIRELEQVGFKSLMPTFEESEQSKIEEYVNFRLNDLAKRGMIDENARTSYDDDDLPEVDIDASFADELVADPNFASILNQNREVVVDGTVYRYTDYGVLFTNVEAAESIDLAIDEINSNRLIPATNGSPLLVSHNVSLQNELIEPIQIDDCFLHAARCGGGGGSGGSGGRSGGGSGGSGGGSTGPTRDEIRDNLKVCEYRSNVLNKIFGPSEKCIDKFESRKRVKIKTWAQNYVLFASTGVKIKSQSRRLRIWWANKIDELELGYAIASFKYTGIGTWPSSGVVNPVDFHYELNGYIVDQYGRYVSGTTPARNLFTNFPLPNDQQLVKIWVYKPIQDVIKSLTGNSVTHLEYSGKDFNKAVRKLVENAVKELKKKGKNINGKPEAVVIFDDPEWNNMNFVYTNWKSLKTNENKISKVFDWNTAQIGIKTGGSSTNPTYGSPKKPKDFNIVCYGMGRRGSTWRGGRIVLTD